MKQNNKGILHLLPLLLVGVLIIGVGYGMYWYGNKNGQQIISRVSPAPEQTAAPTTESTQNPTQKPAATDNHEDWETYSDNTYSFKYPADWKVEPGSTATEEYFGGDYVTIIAPSPTVTINIAPGVFVYGFEGQSTSSNVNEINITTNGKTFEHKESVRIDSGGIKKAFVDLIVPVNSTQYHILFGTGYPVNDDTKASYSDYLKYKTTILEILSTLTIAQ